MQICLTCNQACRTTRRHRLVGMVTRSKIALLSLGIFAYGLQVQAVELQRPSLARIAFDVRQEKRSIALRKVVRYSIYTVGGVTLASILLRERFAKLLPDFVDTPIPKDQSLGYLQILNNRIKHGAGYVKQFLTTKEPDDQAKKIVKEILSDDGMSDFLGYLQHRNENLSWTGAIRHRLWQGAQVSFVVAILSWIEQRPLTLLRTYLDRLWSLWHSNLRKTLLQLSDTATNLEIMRTFVEALGQVHLNERDRKFYVSQLESSHKAFVHSCERLCAMMSIDVDDEDTLNWLGDFDNGFWEALLHFTNLLEEDLGQSQNGEEVMVSQGTRNELEDVRVALQQFVATYRAKNI